MKMIRSITLLVLATMATGIRSEVFGIPSQQDWEALQIELDEVPAGIGVVSLYQAGLKALNETRELLNQYNKGGSKDLLTEVQNKLDSAHFFLDNLILLLTKDVIPALEDPLISFSDVQINAVKTIKDLAIKASKDADQLGRAIFRAGGSSFRKIRGEK